MENTQKIRVQKNQIIAKQKDEVKRWYLIAEGSVIQMNSYTRILLEKGALIGISESGRYLFDYVARQDTVLEAFAFRGADDLLPIMTGKENIRDILLRAAFRQRQKLLESYAGFSRLVRQFHAFVENTYNNYTTFCTKYRISAQNFNRMSNFEPLEMVHKAENWEVNNSASLMKGYLEDYVSLMKRDDALCIGAMMEAGYQSRRVAQGLIEMVDYLKYNKDILLAESENDLFRLFFDLTVQAGRNNCDTTPLHESMQKMAEIIQKIGIYDDKLVTARIQDYKGYDFTAAPQENEAADGQVNEAGSDWQEEPEECLVHILTYAGVESEQIEDIKKQVEEYRDLPDILATDDATRKMRRSLTNIFYDVYYKVFMRAMEDKNELTPIVQMFLNFGFMDVQMVGEERANTLYDLTEHLDVCNSEHVYTIFTWLKSVYDGRNEPSKNEFDLDYPGYLADLRKNGKITAEQVKTYMDNKEMKIKYEIQNMFTSGNRVTYGKLSTFCPILCHVDFINSVEKMLVTAKRVQESIDKIRKVDFSVFYREILFSDPERGINAEMIQKEVLPDVILMPNAGTRAQMWQEIAGVKKDTSARYMLPIFTVVDLDDMMIETTARYRWEICRRIQGVHWNDIRDRSLTSEYCDYLQFYRKNSDLSPEVKDKIRTALLHGKNNYREVFVKDYQNWIKYESRGSFRLNKVAREILLVYCPFVHEIRQELTSNPMYQNALNRYKMQAAKKAQRFAGVYDKYQKAGGTITDELKANLEFYYL